jgi:hypothetical protein
VGQLMRWPERRPSHRLRHSLDKTSLILNSFLERLTHFKEAHVGETFLSYEFLDWISA